MMDEELNWFTLFCCPNRIDYIIAPIKVLETLKESVTYPDEKYSFVSQLSPASAKMYQLTDEEVYTPIHNFV